MMNPAEPTQNERRIEGGAFHPDLPNGRASGEVLIGSDAVQFRSDKGDFDLPLAGLKIELGGASDRLIFFSHPAQPQVTIHTPVLSILNHPVLANNPAFAAQRKKLQATRRRGWLLLLGFTGVVIAGLLGLFLARGSLVRTAAKVVPVDWEIKTGDALLEQVIAGKRIIKDPALEAQLKLITDPLVASLKDNRYPFKFHVVEDPMLNAFALPGGNLVIHSGLLLAADSPEEVAGVLGHEIAHVTQRHSVRSVISSAGLFLVVQTLLGDVTSIVAVLANNSAFLLDRKFSRDFEREADEQGWEYLLAANIKPEGMITFFQKMHEEEQRLRKKVEETTSVDTEGAMFKALSTHPATDERMKSLQAKWDKLEQKTGYRTFDLNYAAFKDSLRAKLHSAEKETDRKEK